ncbi:MAG: insulinase family protein [Deltaproteobacteria bacterium]|nr:insulinase family protein [Deltaproteobacteria bacterium]NND28773.1 insulinase family protein [Myxococcales bacterium]MBT8466776.1 insulinase family protein [Deltaproteobacteria bacterium]MBT8481213.1 insulinase family protein [Deltaproteobacteria bacterium]NNK07329.1 insulinase family protein [Myxococcales bacterium]
MSVLVESSDVLPLVDVEIAFASGSLQDPAGREGLALLTGHLMRRGPRGLSQQRFEDRLASLGARVSVQVSMRSTRIRATVLRRNLEPLLGLLADLVWRPALRARDFAKLKRQARAALIARLDDDESLAARCFREALFGEHPYARAQSGAADSLARIGLPEVESFYARHIARGAFLVGVAGDVTDTEAHRLVSTYFPTAKRHKRKDSIVPTTKTRSGRHVVIVDKPERAQTQLFIGTLGARTRDRNLFPLLVSNTVFGGTFSGLLMQEVRAARGWSYSAYSRLLHAKQREAWYMATAPASEYSADCAALQLSLLERWAERGIKKPQLSFAQRYLINSHCFDRDTPSKRMESRLDVELLGIPRSYVEKYDELVGRVRLRDANDATHARISTRDLSIVVVATATEVAGAFERLPGVKSLEVVPFDRG